MKKKIAAGVIALGVGVGLTSLALDKNGANDIKHDDLVTFFESTVVDGKSPKALFEYSAKRGAAMGLTKNEWANRWLLRFSNDEKSKTKWNNGKKKRSLSFFTIPTAYAAATREQTVEGDSGDYETSMSLSFAGNTTSGNTIVCMVAYNDDSAGTASMSDNKSNTFTEIYQGDSGGDVSGAMFYAYNITGGSSHQMTVTMSANYHDIATVCREYSGLTTTDPLDKKAVATDGYTTSHTSGTTATTAQDDELIVAGIAVDANSTCTAGSGYGNVTDVNGSDLYQAVCIEDKDQTSAATQQATITTSVSTVSYFIVATFKEAVVEASTPTTNPYDIVIFE